MSDDAGSESLVFRAEGLTKVYTMGEVEVHALRGVDLRIRTGRFVVLLGPSGSGKSTLLNILGGLDTPTAGRVFYHDQELTTADESALTLYRRVNVGFVFQFYNLIPSLTARENVDLVTEIADDPMSSEEALGLVGAQGARVAGDSQWRGRRPRAGAGPAVLCPQPTIPRAVGRRSTDLDPVLLLESAPVAVRRCSAHA